MPSDDASTPCPGCGYDLRASFIRDGARCPECGGQFTHRELRGGSFLQVNRRWVRRLAICAAAPVFAAVLAVVIGYLIGRFGAVEWSHAWTAWSLCVIGVTWFGAVFAAVIFGALSEPNSGGVVQLSVSMLSGAVVAVSSGAGIALVCVAVFVAPRLL